MKEIIVGKNEDGKRVDKLVERILCNAGKSFIYKMFRKKNIVLNGKKINGNEIVAKGDSIKIFFSDETFEKMTKREDDVAENKTSFKFDSCVIYEDDNILIANKPSGVLSQKAAADDISMNEYMINYLLKAGKINNEQLLTFRPAFVNRLDRNTSGVIVAGKTLKGLRFLTKIIKERKVDKYYMAVVVGHVKNNRRIQGYLLKDEKTNKVTISPDKVQGSEEIITEYEVAKASQHFSLLKIKLITGKTHQIRAHLASIGHPVAGDYKYGDRVVNDELKKKYGIKDQMLHSYEFLIHDDVETEGLNLKTRKFTATLPDVFKFVKV